MENESCLNRIIAKSESQNATVTERKIALYVKENLEKVLHCNLLELAELIGVSDASMVRFCKSLGYKGFQEFKIRVAMEAIPTEIAALQRTVQTLDMKNIKQVAEILGKASRIVFAGTGGSMIVARDAHHKFLKIGIHVCAVEDKDIQLMEASLLTPGDVLFAVSHSGNNLHVLRAAEVGKSCGATVVGLTSEGKNRLSKIADYTITTISEETIFRSESASTRLAQLAVMDSLIAIVAFQDYDKSFQAIYKTRASTSDNKG